MCFNRDCTSTWDHDIQYVLRLSKWMRDLLIKFGNTVLVKTLHYEF